MEYYSDEPIDGMTRAHPRDGIEIANAALNRLPIAEAIKGFALARGEENWHRVFDMPELHPALMRTDVPARRPAIEIRGDRDLEGVAGHGVTATTVFEATQLGQRTAIAMPAAPGSQDPFRNVQRGDVVRLHRSKRDEPASGYLDLVVTGPPIRIGRETPNEEFQRQARAMGISPSGLAQEVMKKGHVDHLPVRTLSTDAVERPQAAAAMQAMNRKAGGLER